MQSQFKCLGDIRDVSVGKNVSITREPWPFFDVKGGGLIFEDNVVISSGVNILTHSHHFEMSDWRDMKEIIHKDPTVIRKNAFIGINAIIMPSCKYVGESSVIGAGSVVTKNVPDFEIWGGNPSKKIGDVCKK